MDYILSVKNLNFMDFIKYSEINIKENEMTFICGESGSGKSTLLKLFNGVSPYVSGSITYKGIDIEKYDPVCLRKDILLCSQTVYLFDTTIRDNFYEYYSYRDLRPPADNEIIDYLNICCASFPLEAEVRTMSGGERHRVFIAICLSFLPKVIMLDEPTSALDEENSINLLSNLKKFCKEKDITMVVVCHNKGLAEQFADNIIHLRKGKD